MYTYTLLAMKGAARTENGAFSLFTSSRFYYSRSVAIFRPCYSKSCAELKESSRSYAVVGPCFFVLEIIHLPFPSPLKLVQRHPVCPLSLLVAVCIKLRCATHLSLSLFLALNVSKLTKFNQIDGIFLLLRVIDRYFSKIILKPFKTKFD